MRVRLLDGNRVEYSFRQSWLGDYSMCPERTRVKDTLFPDGTPPSSATAIGTAMHAGIEVDLQGGSVEQAYAAINAAYDIEAAVAGFDQDTKHSTAKRTARLAFDGMLDEILPKVVSVDTIEKKFKYLVDRRGDIDLVISGTWDLDEGQGRPLWDWKTAGREYAGWEYQRWAVQPTMYTLAKAIGLQDWSDQQFNYGIAIKRSTMQAPTQFLTVTRGLQDWMWLIDLMWDAVRSHSEQTTWQLRDSGWHCAPKWCPNWDSCKGAPRELTATLAASTPVDLAGAGNNQEIPA